MIAKGGFVYIISNKSRSVLYIGVTSNLVARMYDHKNMIGSAFARRYSCTDLIYYEFHETIVAAIEREKQMKKWKRAWKDELISKFNPALIDLSDRVEDFS